MLNLGYASIRVPRSWQLSADSLIEIHADAYYVRDASASWYRCSNWIDQGSALRCGDSITILIIVFQLQLACCSLALPHSISKATSVCLKQCMMTSALIQHGPIENFRPMILQSTVRYQAMRFIGFLAANFCIPAKSTLLFEGALWNLGLLSYAHINMWRSVYPSNLCSSETNLS